jgi:hypothetical protein
VGRCSAESHKLGSLWFDSQTRNPTDGRGQANWQRPLPYKESTGVRLPPGRFVHDGLQVFRPHASVVTRGTEFDSRADLRDTRVPDTPAGDDPVPSPPGGFAHMNLRPLVHVVRAAFMWSNAPGGLARHSTRCRPGRHRPAIGPGRRPSLKTSLRQEFHCTPDISPLR